MKSPCCNADTRVPDVRPRADGSEIRRRRECTECNQRFTTVERIEKGPGSKRCGKCGGKNHTSGGCLVFS